MNARPTESRDEQTLLQLAAEVRRRTGLVFGPEKHYYLRARLTKLAEARGLSGLSGLLRQLTIAPTPELLRHLTTAVVVGETYFFRDPPTFELFRRELIQRCMTSRTPISVWSAGCSTGEEPYTIAVELLRVATPYGAGVLATDLSASSLEKASRGRYGSSALRFGAEDALKGFARRIGPREVEVIPRVRDLVKFRQHNLLTPATDLGSFDFVFCRNVLIYFDEQTRVQILERIRDVLRPGGLLFTGLTECLLELPDGLVQELHGGAFAFRRKG